MRGGTGGARELQRGKRGREHNMQFWGGGLKKGLLSLDCIFWWVTLFDWSKVGRTMIICLLTIGFPWQHHLWRMMGILRGLKTIILQKQPIGASKWNS